MTNHICPKCKSINKTENKEKCPDCGVIYQKYNSSRKKAFDKTIRLIGERGLEYSDQEFKKLSVQFPDADTEKICKNYLNAINHALKLLSEGSSHDHFKKCREIFTALRDKQPNLKKVIVPYLYQLASKRSKLWKEEELNLATAAKEKVRKEEGGNVAIETEQPLPQKMPTSEAKNTGITNCKTCGEVVSKTAPVCPHCGEKAPELHIKCPRCKSMSIGLGTRGYKLGPASILGSIAIGPAMLLCGLAGRNKPMRVCLNCKHTW